MTGLFKRMPADIPANTAPPAPAFVAALARWLDPTQNSPRKSPDLIDRLINAVQLIVVAMCLLIFFGLAREDRPTTQEPHHHHAALYLLLAASAALMLAGSVQFNRRNRREAVLRDNEDRVTRAAQAANIGLWGWDRDSDRFWTTRTCLAVLGLAPQTELTLEGLLALVQPENQEAVRGAITGTLESGEAHECNFRQVRDGGAICWHRLRVCVNDSLDGHLHLAGSLVDITERRLMETEMETQRRSLTHLSRVGILGELGGALAHELKQPLTAILSNAQALQRLLDHSAIDMTEVRAVIRDIIQDNSRANDVIQHLRSLLKPGESHGAILDLNDVVRDTLDLARNDLMVRRIAISTALHDKSLPILGDSVQLQQLLLNLVFNAAEAMADKPGMMLITTDVMAGPAAHIALADTGPGIKPEVAEKLFEPFVSTKPRGLGLGLSISRAIAISHHGGIWAHNNPGRGATFHLSIPLVREP